MVRKEMRHHNMLLTEKQQKISTFSSSKIDKCEFLAGVEILPSDQSGIIEQAKFRYSLLSKPFEKQIKAIKDQGIRQVKALKALKLDENQEILKSIMK